MEHLIIEVIDLLREFTGEVKELNGRIADLNKEVFTAEEAAEYLRIGYGTILQLARIGQIECVKNGTSYIFKKEHLNNWLNRNKREVV